MLVKGAPGRYPMICGGVCWVKRIGMKKNDGVSGQIVENAVLRYLTICHDMAWQSMPWHDIA